jgi:UPF0042 nucleotide-binding protein
VTGNESPLAAPGKSARLTVVTGLSGAGKSHVSRAFEDMGWPVIDNLPLSLVEPLVDERTQGALALGRTVIVLDARLPDFGTAFPPILRRLKQRPGLHTALVFVEAEDEILRRRYSETRRPHPLGGDPGRAILRERIELAEVRALADSIVDTSGLNVHDLRSRIIREFAEPGEIPAMQVTVLSFGFKHGIPPGADLVFDVRFLPNPHFVPELRPKTGESAEIVTWLEAQEETGRFYDRLLDFTSYLLPRYAAEHKAYLTLAIGCTGGRHRSVYLAVRLAADLAGKGFPVRLFHRDAGQE